MKHLTLLLTAVCILTFATGCAWLNQMGSTSKEQLLSAAGFQARPANTANRQKLMACLNPYKVQMRAKGKNVYYVYPDPKKNILYVGTQGQYQQYQKLAVQQGIAEDQMAAASEMEMMDMDEGGMGFWY